MTMAAPDIYEHVELVKNEVFVFRIPPRGSNRGYRAADWKLDAPDWQGRLKVVSKGEELNIRLEDKDGKLFAECPVDSVGGSAVESVSDSSRYFVLRIKDSGRTAYVGIGFADRSDSFDLNVSIQDHFKNVKKDREMKEQAANPDLAPKLDLGFKEGQTIRINIPKKEGATGAKPRPKPSGGGMPVLLPPPPGTASRPVAVPAAATPPSRPVAAPQPIPDLIPQQHVTASNSSVPAPSGSGSNNLDLLLGGVSLNCNNAPAPSAFSAPPPARKGGSALDDLLSLDPVAPSPQQQPTASQGAPPDLWGNFSTPNPVPNRVNNEDLDVLGKFLLTDNTQSSDAWQQF